MDFERVAVIGVNPISVSIALRLKEQTEPSEIVGYDAQSVAAKMAHAQGAFDRVTRKLEQACEDADLVFIAVPLTDMRETLTAIAPHLRSGCLVTDLAPLKAPVIRWAEELLPEDAYFIGGHPILNPAIIGLESPQGVEARADLLTEALYCLTPSPSGSSAVINAIAELVGVLGAYPFFIDPAEHDGMQAGIEALPDLLTVALLRSTVGTPGWQEMRKFAGHRFAAATAAAGDVHERRAAVFLNRENITGRLNILLGEIARLRDALAQGDQELLEEMLAAATESRERWTLERARGLWGKGDFADSDLVPSAGEQIKHMLLGGSITKRLKRAEPDAPPES